VIAVTTASVIEGYRISQYRGVAQGATFDELLSHAVTLGANAILNACYDDALDVETLYHGSAVVLDPIQRSVKTSTPGAESGPPDAAYGSGMRNA
jgi:uncharacterized protein YbjQ (UPF0145 family)